MANNNDYSNDEERERKLVNYLQKVTFTNTDKAHDWRNYIPQSIRIMWADLTPRELVLVSTVAKNVADNEEWD